MARRKPKNKTRIPRIKGISPNDAWVSYCCVNCLERNFVKIGKTLISPQIAFESAEWKCDHCQFSHAKERELPFKLWQAKFLKAGSISAKGFWRAFFRSACEKPESYWKQCNTCGRILPNADFSKHVKWGPLEKQVECRACKGPLNADQNPKRTKQQLHESSVKRRIADMLIAGENQTIDDEDLFNRFGSKCFKTGEKLDISKRSSWHIDHILPSKYLYPLTKENAALLSKDANQNKKDKWPSEFYTNAELKKLARLVGADLSLLSKNEPVVNKKYDVDKLVKRFLTVREDTDLNKRVEQLKVILINLGLTDSLSKENKKNLGF